MGVFIDLKKAFDTIDHNILLNKLERYGIRGVGLIWVRSYLKNRQQFAQIGEHHQLAWILFVEFLRGQKKWF